jgi:hypothetical protein
MNLRSLMNDETAVCREARLPGRPRPARFIESIFGQNAPARLMSLVLPKLLSARKAAVCFCWGFFLVIPAAVFGQTNYYITNGMEYAIAGSLPGDQVWPDVAVNTNGGFMVWQDNATDGSGLGVSATRLDSTFSASANWSDVRVNVQGTNDQENARVALLKNGGAVFVWQGGVEGFQHIYARFLTPTNTWLTTTDVVVSTPTGNFQVNPAVAVLNNSNVVVVWGSFDQAGSNSQQDVYGQILSPASVKVGTNFLVNQFITYNQRTPAVAALTNGGFVVAWVSEQEQSAYNEAGIDNNNGSPPSVIGLPSVDIYARLYNGGGAATTNEFLVDTGSNPCANPTVAAGSDGGFTIAWDAKDQVVLANSWDIYARSFSGAGAGGPVLRVNTTVYGDQFAPRISCIGTDYMVVWTSMGQDGSREGVFRQFLNGSGTLVGGEFRVNTTTVGPQMDQTVASDGAGQFLSVWTSYTGSPYNFDLFAQRYINVNMASNLPPMAAPFVWAPFVLSNGVYQPQLRVCWAMLSDVSVSSYEVCTDGATNSPALVSGSTNQWVMTAANGLAAGSKHWFQVAYKTSGGRLSPLSAATTNSTWSGRSWGGIPYEWMTNYFGTNMTAWPAASAPAATGGPSLLQVFFTGGNPADSGTWLVQQLVGTPQGMFLTWSTQPGHTYQVLVKTNLAAAWSNLGAPRFAAGMSDSILVGNGSAAYYLIQFLY